MRGKYGYIKHVCIAKQVPGGLDVGLPLKDRIRMFAHYDAHRVLRPDAVKVDGCRKAFDDGAYPPWFPFGELEKKMEDALKTRGVSELPVEASNAAEMREALVRVRAIVTTEWECGESDASHVMTLIKDAVEQALAAPPRNCDVGTAKGQSDRLNLYCGEYGRYCDGSPKCNNCPLLEQVMTNGGKCESIWAQMPYDESEAKA